MDIKLTKIKIIKDNKGKLFEAIPNSKLVKSNNFGHLFYVTFKNKKTIRGNHFHKKSNEYYILIKGKITVELVDINTKKSKSIVMDSKDNQLLRIGPNIAHASKAIVKESILLAYNDEPYDKKSPDTYIYKII